MIEEKDPSCDPQPNVIWFITDQFRAQAQSWMGDPNLHTPNCDIMASEGVAFRRAVSSCPWCTPFRGSVLTGMHAHKVVQKTPQRMDPSLPTLAHAFNDAGYHTAYYGKWHLDGQMIDWIPPERRGGFQEWWAYENRNAPWNNDFHSDGPDGEPVIEHVSDYECDAVTDKLINYLEARRKDKQPFFNITNTVRPHDPYEAPEEFMARHRPADIKLRPNVPQVERLREQSRRDLAGYYAAIENIDWNIGRIRAALRRLGMEKNTWLVLLSDHGDMHGSHGHVRKSCPYEEAIRIPCIFSGCEPHHHSHHSGHTARRRAGISDALISSIDIAPTTLSLCNIPVPESMRGTDCSHHILIDDNRERQDAVLLQQCVSKTFQCLEGTWRGIVTDDGWKYVCSEHGPQMLFNLNEDPCETWNRAKIVGVHHERLHLHQRLRALLDEHDDDFPLPRLPEEGADEKNALPAPS